MQVTTTPSFSPSGEKFEPKQVELQRSWFQAWGFAEPDPPKDATGTASELEKREHPPPERLARRCRHGHGNGNERRERQEGR